MSHVYMVAYVIQILMAIIYFHTFWLVLAEKAQV